jgi:hypothetical protein
MAALQQAAQPQRESPVQAQSPSHDVVSIDLFTLIPPEPPVGCIGVWSYVL